METNHTLTSTSGIVPGDAPPTLTADWTDLTALPATGFNTLTRATRHGKLYLLKGLKEEYAASAVHRRLLRKEFDILASLSHTAVVQAVDWTDVPGLGPCIVEEYVDGMTLADFMATRPPRRERRKVADELIDALRYVHARQVVHRDLKPSNILVTANGHNVKIIDFGLSDTDAWTILKQPAGTPGYMAPEQSTTDVPDCRNDIYSLGVILDRLRPGGAYRAVARRCLRPIDRRYPDMTALGHDLAARLKRRRAAMVAAAVMGPAIVAASVLNTYYAAREQRLSALLSAERTRHANAIDSLGRSLSANTRTATDTIVRLAAPAGGQLAATPPTATPAATLPPDLNALIADGQSIIDDNFRPVEHYFDTLTSYAYFDHDHYFRLMENVFKLPDSYTEGMKADVGSTNATLVMSALYTYMTEKGTAVSNRLNALEAAAKAP